MGHRVVEMVGCTYAAVLLLNLLMPMLKLHNNGLLHSKTVIGPLAVDG